MKSSSTKKRRRTAARTGSRPPDPRPGSTKAGWIVAAVVFALALVLDSTVLWTGHIEGDERIYAALLDQLDAGRGYSLEGHPILEEPWLVRAQYERPLFYHPPAGIGLMWLFRLGFGDAGLGVAQLATFALFYWSMIGMVRSCVGGWTPTVALASSVAAGFNPIVTHVTVHHWLDGPQLAFVAAGSALFVRSITRPSRRLAVVAALVLATACLTKLNALLVLPLLPVTGWALAGNRGRLDVARTTVIVWVLVLLAVCPWLVAQWRVYGELFPSWAGKPDPELVESNLFVYLVTVARGPWSYLRLLPQALWTVVPTLAMLPVLARDRRALRIGGSLVVWIAAVIGVHVALGAVGYSKLLRYVILLVPASIVLFALCVGATLDLWQEKRRGRERLGWTVATLLLALALTGLGLEVAHSVQNAWVYADRSLIRPLIGPLKSFF